MIKRFMWPLMAVTFLAAFLSPPLSLGLDKAAEPVSKAREFQQEGKVDKALEMYDKALDINPDNFDALWSSARLLYKQGSYEEALKRFQAMSAYYPKDNPARIYLGLSKLKVGQADDARGDFLQAIESNPDSVSALIGLGQAELELGNSFTANNYFKKALALNPDNEKLKATIAKLRSKNEQRIEEARQEKREKIANQLNQAISSGPAMPVAPRGRSTEARRAAEAQIMFDIMGMAPPASRGLNRSGARGQSGKSRLGID